MNDRPETLERPQSIKVRVLFFGAARDASGKSELELQIRSPSTTAHALEELIGIFPDLRRFGRSLLVAVNQEYAPRDLEVKEGDELAVFPPVSGGSREVVEALFGASFFPEDRSSCSNHDGTGLF